MPAQRGVLRPGPLFPSPKAWFFSLLPALTAPVLTLISADGNPGQGYMYRPAVPLPSPGTADHAVLPYFKARLWVEEAQAVASPSLGYFYMQLRKGTEKGKTVTSSEIPGSCLPLQPAAAILRSSRSEQCSHWILPSPQRQNSPKPSSRSPMTAPSAPAPTNTQRSPPPLTLCGGFNNSRGKKTRKSKPAHQQAPTCVSGLGRILLQLLSPSLQLLRALVGTEAKSFLF